MLISIVTINLNNLQGLKQTVRSVFEQTSKNFELVVVDGNSQDGSAEFIKSIESDLSTAVIEKDNGIYDAMNKGVERCNGEYVLFLNSGDYLYDKNVLSSFMNLQNGQDIIYGNALLHYKDSAKLKKMPKNLEGTTIFRHTITHQSIFFKTKLFANNIYDLSYKIIADWVYYNTRILLDGATYQSIDLVICSYDMSGLSNAEDSSLRIQKEKERFYSEYNAYFIPLFMQHIDELNQKFSRLRDSPLVRNAIRLQKYFDKSK